MNNSKNAVVANKIVNKQKKSINNNNKNNGQKRIAFVFGKLLN